MGKRIGNIFNKKFFVAFAILFSIITISIGYSALESRLNIAGDVMVRVSADIRITDLKLGNMTERSYETYSCTYSKDSTNFFVTLPNDNSVATYYAEVTNFSDKRYYLKDIIVENYTNKEITYSVEGLVHGQVIEPNTSVDFDIKFLYVIDNPTNNSTTLVLRYVFEEYVETSTDETILLKDKILMDNGGITSISAKGDPDFTAVSTTDEGMYASEDDDGTTYYFRGAVEDNYVLFAGFYWRIVRINGNGSIRLIYQGTTADASGTDATIGSETYKSVEVFGKDKSAPYHTVYNTSSSVRSGTLGNSGVGQWYKSNLINYDNALDYDAGFCNDVADASGTNQVSSSGSTNVTYGGKNRLETTHSPSFKCAASGYYYTHKNASGGNQDLSYPIGVITMDEVYAAGGYSENNTSYYLYNGAAYWTMTPYNYSYVLFGASKIAYMAIVDANGKITTSKVQNSSNVRPVINLKASSIYNYGDGSSSNPYTIGGKVHADASSYYGSTLANAVKGMYEDGDNYIYLHDGSIATGLTDGSYRYSGIDPYNYVCFGSDADTCPSDNLYRIIGVIDGKAKLISADYASTSMLGTDGGYIGQYSTTSSSSDTYDYDPSNVHTYAYNNNSGSSSLNDWVGSLFAETNLNTNFLNSLSETWANKIVDTTWYVGKVNYFTAILTSASSVYSAEINSSQTTYNAKVGMPYAHEYGFGASVSAWSAYMNSYSNSNIRDGNWMYLGLTEWTISHGDGGSNNNAATISSDGGFSYDKVYNGHPVRITFSIDASVVLNSGTGTMSDPFRIS